METVQNSRRILISLEIDPDIGRNLQRLRKAAKLTQAQLAERMGVHITTVQHIEAQRNSAYSQRDIPYEQLEAYLNAVGVKPSGVDAALFTARHYLENLA